MAKLEHRRHDISDKLWEILDPLLPGRKGKVGRHGRNNGKFINAVFWILRTGAPWRDLPPDLGGWKNIHRRYCRWRDRGVWENILVAVSGEPDLEWLMIDSTHIKVHQHRTGARGGTQGMARTKGGLTRKYIWPWLRMVIRSELLQLKVQNRIADGHWS
jgi:transposase